MIEEIEGVQTVLSFPMGAREHEDETSEETAAREYSEEVGCSMSEAISIISDSIGYVYYRGIIFYVVESEFSPGVMVDYYTGNTKDQPLRPDAQAVIDFFRSTF
jgi:8-oxo-dGTP pyrophosphatase MutT (NUDIX family)